MLGLISVLKQILAQLTIIATNTGTIATNTTPTPTPDPEPDPEPASDP